MNWQKDSKQDQNWRTAKFDWFGKSETDWKKLNLILFVLTNTTVYTILNVSSIPYLPYCRCVTLNPRPRHPAMRPDYYYVYAKRNNGLLCVIQAVQEIYKQQHPNRTHNLWPQWLARGTKLYLDRLQERDENQSFHAGKSRSPVVGLQIPFGIW